MAQRRKQVISHEDFLNSYRESTLIVSKREVDLLVERTVEQIHRTYPSGNVAYCWSGGKDSIALEYICREAGIESCVLVLTNLEYPKFLSWVTDHMPPGLVIVNNGWDMDWLVKHQDWIFPQDSATASKWYAGVQWKGQDQFFFEHGVEALLMGRRLKDGNRCGDARGISKKKNGVVRYAPIREWTHEQIFALIRYYNLDLPPIYDWPRGFRVGSGPWPARRWCDGVEMGWQETWTINPDLVRQSYEAGIASAVQFMDKFGLS